MWVWESVQPYLFFYFFCLNLTGLSFSLSLSLCRDIVSLFSAKDFIEEKNLISLPFLFLPFSLFFLPFLLEIIKCSDYTQVGKLRDKRGTKRGSKLDFIETKNTYNTYIPPSEEYANTSLFVEQRKQKNKTKTCLGTLKFSIKKDSIHKIKNTNIFFYCKHIKNLKLHSWSVLFGTCVALVHLCLWKRFVLLSTHWKNTAFLQANSLTNKKTTVYLSLTRCI